MQEFVKMAVNEFILIPLIVSNLLVIIYYVTCG